MRVDGRDITVSGSLLQPLTRRTNDILRVVLAALFLAIVIAGSVVTRNKWVALERSVSGFLGVLTIVVSSHSGTLSGTRFWKNDGPSAPSGKCCKRTGRPPIVRMIGSSARR